MHRNKGFVLAEVLVVAVIVAILAAVAIPVYTSYVSDQRQEVVNNLAQTASVSANIFWRRFGHAPRSDTQEHTIEDLKMFLPDPDRFQIIIDSPMVMVKDTTYRFESDSVKFIQ